MLRRRQLLWRTLASGLLVPGQGWGMDYQARRRVVSAPTASFTFVQGAAAAADIPGVTTASVSLTGVTAGNMIVLWTKWEGAATSDSASDGTSTLTQGSLVSHSNADLHGRFYYLLAANSGNRTYTQTLGAVRNWRRLVVFEYSYTGTVSLDGQATGSGASSGVFQSGTLTTTGSVGVGFGGYGEYSAATVTNHGINGSNNRDGVLAPGGATNTACAWRRILSSTFTNGTAQGSMDTSGDWICNLLVLKAS